MESIRRSFQHGQFRKSPSRDVAADLDHEQQPILSDHRHSADRAEVVVKIDGNSQDFESQKHRVWRESSYEFWKDADVQAGEAAAAASVGAGERSGKGGGSDNNEASFAHYQRPPMIEISEDPPSKLLSSFLIKQKASGNVSLDMDMEMDELQKPSLAAASKELRVSFQDPSADSLHRRSSTSHRDNTSSSSDDADVSRGQSRVSSKPRGSGGVRDGAEVLKCTSNSFRRSSGFPLLRTKTKSRLIDPQPAADEDGRKCSSGVERMPKSGLLRSGMMGRNLNDEDEDDPFLDEDIPDEFKRTKFDFLTVLQWISLLVIVAALACSLSIPFLERYTLWNLHLWKWEVLVLVLICGRLVSGWFIRVVVFFIERNFLLRKRVLYFVYGVRKAVQNCLWLGLVLIAWNLMFDKKLEMDSGSKNLRYVTKVLVCLLVAVLMWLLKTLLLKVLASSFHVSTYFDRIQESLFNQYVIETLSGPPLVEIQHNMEEEDQVMAEVQKLQNAGATIPPELKAAALPIKSGRLIGGSKGETPKSVKFSGSVMRKDVSKQQDEMNKGITIDHLHKLNQKNVSAWNMKRLMKIVRHGALATLDEQISDANEEDESATQIRSEYEAKIAARKIFTNVAEPGAKFIYLVDLMRFMREEEAQKTMTLFEGAQESKRVSKRSLKNWVVTAFRERRALSLTLNDTKTAVNKLHQMVNVVVGVVVFIIWLIILGIATTHVLLLVSSQLLLVTFTFGNTCKMVFEAIIFLFVMHPFDVGDRCEVDGVQMVVEEMNILTTIFLRYDNQKITFPNSKLATLPIGNFYRSPDMGDAIDFCIHVSTPLEKVAIMKERIKGYIESKKEHWCPGPSVVLRDVDDMNRLRISVWLQHRMNYQDMGERWNRRELVMQEMIRVLRELDIEYRMLPLDVNVRQMPALSSSRLPSTWTTCS